MGGKMIGLAIALIIAGGVAVLTFIAGICGLTGE